MGPLRARNDLCELLLLQPLALVVPALLSDNLLELGKRFAVSLRLRSAQAQSHFGPLLVTVSGLAEATFLRPDVPTSTFCVEGFNPLTIGPTHMVLCIFHTLNGYDAPEQR